MYALIDGNTFYASCERVFQPKLNKRPVIVLSNNDGCVVTLTKEAKALGIKRGVPLFQIQEIVDRHDVAVFSSNYELYADMSDRMMQTIATLVPEIHVYSIDECFACVDGMSELTDLTDLGRAIRARVLQWIGIPTCVGIAPTKTLAKYCNHLAKHYGALNGVLNWNDLTPERQAKALACQSVNEVWGVGARLTERLNRLGIVSALDLARCPQPLLREHFPVTLLRTAQELNGIDAIAFEDARESRAQIVRSRSFGEEVTDFDALRAAVIEHTQEAARVLRREGLSAQSLTAFIHSNRFKSDMPYYGTRTIDLGLARCDTATLTRAAETSLKKIYRRGIAYKKAGVILTQLQKTESVTPDLFEAESYEKNQRLSGVLDQINDRFGKGTLVSAAVRVPQGAWKMKRDRLSPAYTTRLSDLLCVD